jgi:5'-nucleotidase
MSRLSDLSTCRILLSNDDGIAAEGLAVLEKIARALSDDVWVVAPAIEQSGAGHSLTLHHPLRPVKLGPQRYTVSGTPTDCVMVAVNHLLKDHPPDLVLSGINMGANLGEDVHYSGTVAAALEATLLGVPAIAISQVIDEMPIDWATAQHFVPGIIRRVCATGWPATVMININLPDRAPGEVKDVVATAQGKYKLGDELIQREDPRGRPYIWIGARRTADANVEGTDLKAIDEGRIAVTPLNVDLTHAPTLAALRKSL